MATYFVVNTPSNLIIGIVSTSYIPANTPLKTFVLANERALDIYYAHLKRDAETLLDAGELMMKSGFITDQITNGKGTAKPQSQRVRAEQVLATPPSRESQVRDWLCYHPNADVYDLNEAFCMGMVAARQYIQRYGYQE